MSAVMVLDLNSAEQLLEHTKPALLREELGTAMFFAEGGDICSDVFLFEFIEDFTQIARDHNIKFVFR